MYEPEYYHEPWPIRLAKTLQLPRLMRLPQRSGAIIVSYHGVVSDQDWHDWETSDMVAESVFRKHLAFFRKHYRVISLKSLVAGLSGKLKLPKRALAITFDDGYRNNLQYAVPALKDYGLTATFFLTTGFLDKTDELWWLPVKKYVLVSQQRGNGCEIAGLGKFAAESTAAAGHSYRMILSKLKELPGHARSEIVETVRQQLPAESDLLADVYAPMTWPEARNMVAVGMEVGAHSVSHLILANEPEEKISQEVHDSVERINTELDLDGVAFSYPDGQLENCRQAVIAEVKKAGCYTGLMNFPGLNRKGDDPFQLRRFPVGGHHTPVRLELDLCGLRALKARLMSFLKGGYQR